MKCEMIRDLLPLYIDGLTSEESNREIEKNLKNCRGCQKYYQEMTGEIGEDISISEEEIQELQVIKKIKKKNKRKMFGVLTGIVLALAVCVMVLFTQWYSSANSEEVTVDYGVRGNVAYCAIETKPGYSMEINGSSSHLKILRLRKTMSPKGQTISWEEKIGTEENPCKWTIEFQDKIMVIENGQLTKEKEK